MDKSPITFTERVRQVRERDGNFWRDLEAAQRLVDSKRPKPGVLTA